MIVVFVLENFIRKFTSFLWLIDLIGYWRALSRCLAIGKRHKSTQPDLC